VNLDWTLLGSATNTVLKGDTTYYVSGLVTLSASGSNGVTTIEGGVCVKFTNDLNAKIIFSGPIDCRADAYRIDVFTIKDSYEVGEKITGSTGNPTNFYGNGIEVTNSSTLKNLRFAYASTAIRLDSGQTLNLWDSQFVKCSLA